MNAPLTKVPVPVVWAEDSAEKIVEIPLAALPAHVHQDSSYNMAPKQSVRVMHPVSFFKNYFSAVLRLLNASQMRVQTLPMRSQVSQNAQRFKSLII